MERLKSKRTFARLKYIYASDFLVLCVDILLVWYVGVLWNHFETADEVDTYSRRRIVFTSVADQLAIEMGLIAHRSNVRIEIRHQLLCYWSCSCVVGADCIKHCHTPTVGPSSPALPSSLSRLPPRR